MSLCMFPSLLSDIELNVSTSILINLLIGVYILGVLIHVGHLCVWVCGLTIAKK